MTIKIANRDKLSLELLLTTKQKTKARNTFQKKNFNWYKAVQTILITTLLRKQYKMTQKCIQHTIKENLLML